MKKGTPQPSPTLLQQCLIHESAMRPGFPLSLHPRCPCCHYSSHKQFFGLCFQSIKSLYLGTGVVLFFRFLIMCFLVSLISTCGYSIVQIISNIQQQSVSVPLMFAISNVNSITNHNQMNSYILAAVTIVLMLIIPIFLKLSLRILDRACSDSNQYFYPQILALLFELQKPAGTLTQEQVMRTLNDWCEVDLKINHKPINGQLDVVEAVYFHFNLQEYTLLKHQISQLEKQKEARGQEQDIFEQYENNQVNAKNYSSKRSISSKYSYSSMKKKFSRLDELYQKLKNKQIEKTNKFIVVFKCAEYMELVKSKVQSQFCSNYVNKLIFPNDNSVIVRDAPFPSEINYAVQHFPQKQVLKRRLISWSVTVFIIIAGSGIQYLALYLLEKYVTLDSSMLNSLITACAIYVIGEIGLQFSLSLISYECQGDKTSENCSQNFHLMAVGIFLRCLSIFGIFYISSGKLPTSVAFVETLTCFVVIWPTLMLINRFINFRVISACFTKSKIKSSIKYTEISQGEANKLCERPNNQMHRQYAHSNIFVFSCFLFASVIPVSLLSCSIYFLLSFLVERITFAYIESQPQPSNHRLFVTMSCLLWKSVVGLPLGHYFFLFTCDQNGSPQSSEIKIIYAILLAVGCILLLIPPHILQNQTKGRIDYEQIKEKFLNTYQQFNHLYEIMFIPEPPKQKQAIPQANKSQMLAEQLNTMSKSLETTLRDKIFNKKNPALEALNNREQDSLYFQFDDKVEMPQKKESRKPVPPIFKQDRQDLLLKKSSKKAKNLIKLTHLVTSQQEAEIKNKIKTAIKDSINKIQ